MGYKSKRILYIYKKLLSKHHVNVKNLSEFFSTNERTIQRDIEDINTFLKDYDQTVLYEKATHDYYISHKNIKYSNTDINIHATYEMTYQVFKKLNKQYETYIVQKTRRTITVMLFISKIEAINLCFTYHNTIRIVSPETLVAEFTQELAKIQKNYILNKI